MSFVHEYRKKHKQESIVDSEVNSVMDSLLGKVTKDISLSLEASAESQSDMSVYFDKLIVLLLKCLLC